MSYKTYRSNQQSTCFSSLCSSFTKKNCCLLRLIPELSKRIFKILISRTRTQENDAPFYIFIVFVLQIRITIKKSLKQLNLGAPHYSFEKLQSHMEVATPISGIREKIANMIFYSFSLFQLLPSLILLSECLWFRLESFKKD